MSTITQRIRHWWNWRWFRRNQDRLRNVAAWAVHHHSNGGSHDRDSILSGSADRRIYEAAAAPVDLGAVPALRPSIYIASKTRHAMKWLALREGGHRIVSTWIDEAGPGESVDLGDLAERCIEESKAADLFIIYSEPGDVLKGAWAEAGARLAAGKVVLAVGPFDRSAFTHHVNWRSRATVGDALACAAGGGGGRGEGR